MHIVFLSLSLVFLVFGFFEEVGWGEEVRFWVFLFVGVFF